MTRGLALRILAVLMAAGVMLAGGELRAQTLDLGPAVSGAASARGQHVELLTDAVKVVVGKAAEVEVRFRVLPGFHINSHRPTDELLLPTLLSFEPVAPTRVLGETFPAGQPFRLAVGAGELLDVYQGEFAVTVRLLAAQGEATLTGSLHYQACDAAACYPPRVLPVRVALRAR